MNYKNLTITFADDETAYFEQVDELAVAMNGFLVVSMGDQRFYYNFDSITSYSFKEVTDEEQPSPRDNLHVIN